MVISSSQCTETKDNNSGLYTTTKHVNVSVTCMTIDSSSSRHLMLFISQLIATG